MPDWVKTTMNRRMVEFTTLAGTDIWIRSDTVITVEQDDDDGTTSIITLGNGKVIFVQESPLEVLIELGYKGRS
jgi:uncharacterized protein YlzI (FlbEa/FlbD family)